MSCGGGGLCAMCLVVVVEVVCVMIIVVEVVCVL